MKATRVCLSAALSALLLAACDATPQGPEVDGAALYADNCLVCHQADGGGVPFMQPPLDGSSVVLGEARDLADFVLNGTVDREDWQSDYQNRMPGFAHLGDADLAAILTYVRGSFGNSAGAVSAEDVAAARAGD